jgi:adenine-specific DNA-methyltransferase
MAFLEMLSLRRIHVLASRNKAFGDDNVLQENIIFSAIRETGKPKQVIISTSDSDDFANVDTMNLPYDPIVHSDDRDVFTHLGIDDTAISVMKQMQWFKCTLDKLNLNVSTGHVVDFRAKKHLRQLPQRGTAPLIYPCHFQDSFISWPLESGKKPNAIVSSPDTSGLLVEAGYYVLTKRFSSKEQKRRAMAKSSLSILIPLVSSADTDVQHDLRSIS